MLYNVIQFPNIEVSSINGDENSPAVSTSNTKIYNIEVSSINGDENFFHIG